MADFETFTINDDGNGTPVAHEFVPNGKDGNLVVYTHDNGLSLLANDRITIDWRKTPTIWVGRVKFALPKAVTENINGVDRTKVDHTVFVELKVTAPLTSTKQERRDALTLVKNILDSSNAVRPFWDVVVKGEGVF